MSTCPECRGKGTLVVQVSGSRVPNIEECDVCEGTGRQKPPFDHTLPASPDRPDPEWLRRDVAPLQADETVEVPFREFAKSALQRARKTFAERGGFLPVAPHEAPYVVLRDHVRDAFVLRSHQREQMASALSRVLVSEEGRLLDTTADLDGCRVVIDLKGDTVRVTLTNHTPDAVRYVDPKKD